jgi:hypothetical protein
MAGKRFQDIVQPLPLGLQGSPPLAIGDVAGGAKTLNASSLISVFVALYSTSIRSPGCVEDRQGIILDLAVCDDLPIHGLGPNPDP